MITILFDLLCAQPNQGNGSKFHGGGEYTKTVLKKLVEMYNNKVKIYIYYNSDLYIDEWIIDLIKTNHLDVINITSYIDLESVFKKYMINIFFTGLPSAEYLEYIPENVRKVGTIHGLRVIEKPTDKNEYRHVDGYKSLRRRIKPFFFNYLRKKGFKSYQKIIDELDDVICVSKHTKYSIAFYLHCPTEKLKVFYTPEKYINNSLNLENRKIEDKYILLLGLNRWIKNGFRAIQSIEAVFERNMLSDYKVILVGNVSNNLKKIIKNINRYIMYDYLDTSDLENLYKNCDIFFYPSLNEGFGMPPLEAMKYGKTCVVSNICSLPEVCGSAVYYCNPYDVEEMSNRLIMASEEKIDERKIKLHLDKINSIQRSDLNHLCDFIVGKYIREKSI